MSRRPRLRPLSVPLFRVCGALVLALIPGGPAGGQSPAQQVRNFVGNASGFALLGDHIEEGSLPSGRQLSFPFRLTVGVDYMVVGYCDPACTDLDLSILDPAGEEAGNDYLPDAQPVLMLTPKVGGVFQIQVEMVTCSAEPCGFAVGILEGEIPAELGLMGGDMEDRLNIFRSDLEGEGFTEVGDPESGGLDADQEMRFPLALTASVEYRLAGVCDNDCDDLDLILYGPSGEEVASDLLVDAVPMLAVTPTSTGTYRLAVVMVGCRIEPCGFMVGTFAKGEGLEPGGEPLSGNVLVAETHQGNLEEGDDQLEEGEFYDEYTIQVQAGQTIVLDLRSPDFDTFLILRTPGGDQEQNDDWQGDSMHSRMELVAPETGTYTVLVTSFMAGEMGPYTLEVAIVEGGV